MSSSDVSSIACLGQLAGSGDGLVTNLSCSVYLTMNQHQCLIRNQMEYS